VAYRGNLSLKMWNFPLLISYQAAHNLSNEYARIPMAIVGRAGIVTSSAKFSHEIGSDGVTFIEAISFRTEGARTRLIIV
jgi:hypothetical protein